MSGSASPSTLGTGPWVEAHGRGRPCVTRGCARRFVHDVALPAGKAGPWIALRDGGLTDGRARHGSPVGAGSHRDGANHNRATAQTGAQHGQEEAGSHHRTIADALIKTGGAGSAQTRVCAR